ARRRRAQARRGAPGDQVSQPSPSPLEIRAGGGRRRRPRPRAGRRARVELMDARLKFDVASAAYGAEADSISGAIVTVKKCHRQTFRRFLTGVPSGRIAVSYTKRRRGLTSDD